MEPFVGELRLMPYSFTPKGWMPCEGQLMAVSSNTALFSLLGTQYGGNGQQTFGLPDLRGRAIVGMGQGPGLHDYRQGEVTGTETVTLLSTNLPAHTHGVDAKIPVSTVNGQQTTPAGNFFAANATEQYGSSPAGTMAAGLISGPADVAGGNQSHDNRMPYLALRYCIATVGIYPPRQ